jgi:hypothetical protein
VYLSAFETYTHFSDVVIMSCTAIFVVFRGCHTYLVLAVKLGT